MILPHMSTLPISGRRNKSGWLCPSVIRVIPKDTTPNAPMQRILLTQQLVLVGKHVLVANAAESGKKYSETGGHWSDGQPVL